MAIDPGMYSDFDMKKYHADPALSRSDIVRLYQSPALYKNHEDVDKPEYRFGRAFHGLVLQGIPFEVNGHDLRTKLGKKVQADYPDALSQKDTDLCYEMADKIQPFFVEGDPEVSFFWYEDDILCKCRPDWMHKGIVTDLKTTQRRNLDDFHWDAWKFFYDVQAAWYPRGVEQFLPVSTFQLIVIQKVEPFGIRIFQFENLDRADRIIQEGLGNYRQCRASGQWTDPPVKVEML